MKPLILCVFLLSACAAHPVTSSSAEPTGCVAPAATRAPGELRIPEAPDQSSFDFKLGERSLRVGQGRYQIPGEDRNWNQMYGFGPVIWIKDGKRERAFDLRAEFPSHLVSRVFVDEMGGRIMVFLENGVEGPGNFFSVWISLDRGDHWFAGADLDRPGGVNSAATLVNFLLTRDGRGFALLAAEGEHDDIFYRANTPDCGRSWSAEPLLTSVVRPVEETR